MFKQRTGRKPNYRDPGYFDDKNQLFVPRRWKVDPTKCAAFTTWREEKKNAECIEWLDKLLDSPLPTKRGRVLQSTIEHLIVEVYGISDYNAQNTPYLIRHIVWREHNSKRPHRHPFEFRASPEPRISLVCNAHNRAKARFCDQCGTPVMQRVRVKVRGFHAASFATSFVPSLQLRSGVEHILQRDDVVPLQHRPRFMATDEHRLSFRDSRILDHHANTATSQVVKEEFAGTFGLSLCASWTALAQDPRGFGLRRHGSVPHVTEDAGGANDLNESMIREERETLEKCREAERRAVNARWAKWRAEHPEKAMKRAAGRALVALRRVKSTRQERTEALRQTARGRSAQRRNESSTQPLVDSSGTQGKPRALSPKKFRNGGEASAVSSNPLMTCPERRLLLQEYGKAVRTYHEAVRKFVDRTDEALGSDLDLIRLTCRKAWERAEQARLALYRHEADHFCDRFPPPIKI